MNLILKNQKLSDKNKNFSACPSSARPSLQDRQERQVGVPQVGPPPVLKHVADGPRQTALGVVQRPHNLAIQSQLQDQGVARQQDVVPAQRDHLEKHNIPIAVLTLWRVPSPGFALTEVSACVSLAHANCATFRSRRSQPPT